VGTTSIHEQASLLRDAVFSADDGIITTFAIVAGSTAAGFSSSVVLVLGFANVLADGISMASGIYVGVKSEKEFEKERGVSHWKSDSPIKHALIAFASFAFGGVWPLVPYLFIPKPSFFLTIAIVGISMFAVGVIKSYYTRKNWLRSGTEVVIIGLIAATIAYLVGFAVDRFVI